MTTSNNPHAPAPAPAPAPAHTRWHRSDNADAYRTNASFVFSSEYTRPVLELLDPQPGDRILDFGCGTGELTYQISSIVSQPSSSGSPGYVLGLDAGVDMIAKAREGNPLAKSSAKVEGKPDFESDVVDAHELETYLDEKGLKGSFDKVFSNAALHWMKRDPARVVRGVHAALKPGGTFAAEMGGFMNMVGVRSALHSALKTRGVDPESVDPWYFPTPAQCTSLLCTPLPRTSSPAFSIPTCTLHPRPTPLPSTGLTGWLQTFAGPFLTALPDEETRKEVVREVESRLRPDLWDEGEGRWWTMYVRRGLRL